METLLTLRALEDAGLGDRVTIWRRRRSGDFPEPDINLGTEQRPQWRWFPETIEKYLESVRIGPVHG